MLAFGVDKHKRLYAVVDDSVMDAYEKQTSLKPYLEDMPILLIRKTDDRVKDLEILAKFSSSPVRDGAKKVQGEQNTGGIDFNARNMDVTAQGDQGDFTLPNNVAVLQFENVSGFTPTIINITPITNVPELLGLNESSGRIPQEVSLAR